MDDRPVMSVMPNDAGSGVTLQVGEDRVSLPPERWAHVIPHIQRYVVDGSTLQIVDGIHQPALSEKGELVMTLELRPGHLLQMSFDKALVQGLVEILTELQKLAPQVEKPN